MARKIEEHTRLQHQALENMMRPVALETDDNLIYRFIHFTQRSGSNENRNGNILGLFTIFETDEAENWMVDRLCEASNSNCNECRSQISYLALEELIKTIGDRLTQGIYPQGLQRRFAVDRLIFLSATKKLADTVMSGEWEREIKS